MSSWEDVPIRVSAATGQLVTPYSAGIASLLGNQVARFRHNGDALMAVPHTLEMVRLLRNMNLPAPNPIRTRYGWGGGKPFDSQIATADLLTLSSRAYVLSQMGVGKTRAAMFAYDFLRSEGEVDQLLVVAPLSTLTPVWANEVFAHFPHLQSVVLHGDRKKRLKLLSVPAQIYIINHDGVETIHEALLNKQFSAIIIDELGSFRNSRALRWKYMRPLVANAKYVWGLTGSPTPESPTDAYGQVKLLTPGRMTTSFKAFKDATMRQISPFTWIARPDAKQIVAAAMQPSIRFTRAECLDLPAVTYSDRQVELSPASEKAYKEMLNELATNIRAKEITAANDGVKLSKLLQIAAGFAYDSSGNGNYIGGASRIRAVFDVVDGLSDSKCIVFCPFTFLVEAIHKALSRRYACAVVHGGTSRAERDEAFTSFQNGTDPKVIVAHPQTMAHGLTLTAANTIVWAAPVTSLEIYEQANARITRPGQKQDAHIIHLMGTAAEKRVYKKLASKASMQGALLELFESLNA